jgi:hypothetical protein
MDTPKAVQDKAKSTGVVITVDGISIRMASQGEVTRSEAAGLVKSLRRQGLPASFFPVGHESAQNVLKVVNESSSVRRFLEM